ncbi:MAG: superoxide dismutase, partial [Firmicutes bacterium]|nr:superoxide dismutase [Bacillota bacterium]
MEQTLPFPLPYAADALEPIISQRTMELHDALAAGYANNFPAAQAGVPAAVNQGEQSLREQLRTLSFQGSGYVLHNVYFANMAPAGSGGAPGPNTMRLVTQQYPSLTAFQHTFLGAGNAAEGPGWAVWGWLPATSKPYILQCEEHNNKTIWGIIPMLVLDVWEHAYLLDYGSNRAAYTAGWWQLINWDDVEYRVTMALQG